MIFAFLFPDPEGAPMSLSRFGPIMLDRVFVIPGLTIALPLGLFCLWCARRLPDTRGET